MSKYEIYFSENVGKYYNKFDNQTKNKIKKKIEQMENDLKPRRLHNSIYCVEEIGQYRIGYILREKELETIQEIKLALRNQNGRSLAVLERN
ncbi:MAG: hypothetical protein EOM23_10635 [Candidatus Moranbacteria bacterium]|nr:hypothetical protein [Candidatus Moranbacteria bacterium]